MDVRAQESACLVRPVVAAVLPTFLPPEMRHVHRQIVGLARYRPVVIASKVRNPAGYPADDLRVLPRPWWREARRFLFRRILRRPLAAAGSEAAALGRALAVCRADVVHVYFGNNGIYWLPWMEGRGKLPVVLSFHGADGGVGMGGGRIRPVLDRLFRSVNLVLVRSNELADAVGALGCPRDRIRLHHAGIPIDEFAADPWAAPEGGAFHLVQACRLIPKKGIDLTLRAFAAVRNDFPNARLSIAGEGPLLGALRDLARDLGIADVVDWPGFLDAPSYRRLLAGAHLFVHPSRATPDGDREGIPNSLLEAMACGRPVVATRHGGIPEAVTDGAEGRLIPENDVRALAAAVRDLLAAPRQLEAMGLAAATAIRQRFDTRAQTARLESLYDEARAT